MDNVADRSTRDIISSHLKLSDELIFTPQVHGTEIFYHIEAPSRGAFYRIGYPEYFYISLLNGERTVAQAITMTARRLGTRALTQSQCLQITNWLLESGLAEFAEEDAPSLTRIPEQGGKSSTVLKQFNPFWMKFSLGSPDQILTALAPSLGCLFAPQAMLAGLAVIMFGIGCLALHWEAFAENAASVMAPSNWIWMGLTWILLKIVHEMAHGLACKYYRGEVRETGVVFMLFAPMAYVDVTSCWRLASKWNRIHVAAAGMYVELLLASLAAIVWVNVDSLSVQHLLRNVIIMASLSTLLFNANPLMRFDGYYILSDLLGIPNLATEGRKFLKQLIARVFYGTNMPPMPMVGFRRWCVRFYGLASCVWQIQVCVSLAAAAAVLLHGAGVLLAAAGLFAWFGRPLCQTAINMRRRFHEARTSFVRAVGIGSVFAVMAVVISQLPMPGAMTAPAVVEFADLAVVRSDTQGFVERVHVIDGQTVAAGQLLVELRNDELEAGWRELELSLEQERVRQRIALSQRDASGVQVAARNLQAIAEKLSEIQRRVDRLRVVAPVSGRVIASRLQLTVGVYVQEGEDMLAIGDEQKKELVVSVGQEEINSLLPLIGEPAICRIGSRAKRPGVLQRLDPRASLELPHPAMSSSIGGPLAVTEQGDSQRTGPQLTEPRFRGIVSLSPAMSHDLGAGEQGYVLIGHRSESIGEFLWLRSIRWLELLIEPPHV